MAFKQKTWTNRVAEYINRRLLTYEDGRTELVTVARSEGKVSVEGDGFDDKNMNDLEQRIADEFTALNNAIGDLSQNTQGQFVLADGLKICWGRNTATNGDITFPIEFRSTPYVVGTFRNSNSELWFLHNILTASNTGFTYQGKYTKNMSTWITHYAGFEWIAIGY